MQGKTWRTGLCGCLCALALGACAGTETGNPSFKGSLGYDAYSSARAVALTAASGDAAAEPLRVDNAWLVLGDVELLPAQACGASAGSGLRVHGLGAGDHAAGQAPATAFDLEAGQYCGVRLPFVHASDRLPKDAPQSLREESIALIGTLPDGRDFELRSALETRVLLRADGGFALDDEHAGVVIGFDVGTWLDGMDWSAAEPEADSGRVLIDADHNRNFLLRFETALPQGVALFRDENRDGLLDADHRPIALTP